MTTQAQITERKMYLTTQIAKFTSELTELEAAEKVFARFGGPSPTPSKSAATPMRRRGRPAKTAMAKSNGEVAKQTSFAKALNQVISAGASGITRDAVLKACPGMRANHLGIAINRWKKSNLAMERDGKIYAWANRPAGRQPQASATQQYASP